MRSSNEGQKNRRVHVGSHFAQPSSSIDKEGPIRLLDQLQPLAIVWRAGTHRCEYWKARGDHGQVRLYDGSSLKMDRLVATIEEMRATAMLWRKTIVAAVDQAERPRIQRAYVERRRITRAGRRDGDPAPTCPSCGLPIAANPHGSDAECVAALRRELSRIRARPRE